MKESLKNDFHDFVHIAKDFLAVSGGVFWILIILICFYGGN